MNIAAGVLTAALAASLLGAGLALAQPVRHDPVPISSDKMIGAPVYNDRNQRIGTLEDILVQPSPGEPRLVLSVGDFIGHDKKVAVPLSRVALEQGRLMMAGGTKEALEKMPTFSYGADSR
ncbi:MAG TPA: PRC-barrel domain-containing protein [Acetobacteraceae bacterium]|nr:PRC-barrel domain-containing protein [Acetobacteraceae bacterium]